MSYIKRSADIRHFYRGCLLLIVIIKKSSDYENVGAQDLLNAVYFLSSPNNSRAIPNSIYAMKYAARNTRIPTAHHPSFSPEDR